MKKEATEGDERRLAPKRWAESVLPEIRLPQASLVEVFGNSKIGTISKQIK